jgi:hypothetical protein
VSVVERRLWQIFGLLCGVAALPVRAQTGAPDVQVQLAADACPSPALLRQKLQPLLGEDATLAIDAAPEDRVGAVQASLRDLGDRYALEVEGLSREVGDRARDCIERARVAAVFIALNVNPPPEAAPSPPDAAEAEPVEPRPEDGEQAMRWGVRFSGEAAYAAAIDAGAFGAGAGVWLGLGTLRLEAGAGALSPAQVQLDARADIRGSVGVMRIPLTASASYLLRAGPLAFGPALGLALDLLRLRGEGLERPQTELRVNPGAFAAADAHMRLTPALSTALRVALSAFPRAYDLSVDPEGRLARTPRLWLSASLGLAWQVN